MWIAASVSVATSAPLRVPDSPDYIAGGDGIGVISFVGNSIRAWPTVLLFSSAGSDNARVAIQTVLFLVAWTILIWAFLAHARPQRALIVGGLLAVFALSPSPFQWNLILVSESLTISLVIGGIALMRLGLDESRYATTWSWLGLLALALASVNKLPLVVLLVALLGFHIMRLALTAKSGPEQRRRHQRTIALSAAAGIVLVIYPVLVNTSIDRAWAEQRQAQVTRNGVNYYFLTAKIDPANLEQVGDSRLPSSTVAAGRGLLARDRASADQLHAALPADAPECLRSTRATLSDTEGPFTYAQSQIRVCPAGVEWVNANFLRWYALFVGTNPKYVIDTMMYRMPLSLAQESYATYISIVPPALSLLFADGSFGGVTSFALAMWLLAGLVAIGVLALRFFTGGRDDPAVLLSVVYVAALAAWMLTLLLMNAEVFRIAVVSLVPLVAASILLIDAALTPRSSRDEVRTHD